MLMMGIYTYTYAPTVEEERVYEKTYPPQLLLLQTNDLVALAQSGAHTHDVGHE